MRKKEHVRRNDVTVLLYPQVISQELWLSFCPHRKVGSLSLWRRL